MTDREARASRSRAESLERVPVQLRMDSALQTLGCGVVLAVITLALFLSGSIRRQPKLSFVVIVAGLVPLGFFTWLAYGVGHAWQGVRVLDEMPRDEIPGTWVNGNVVAVFLDDGGVVLPDGGPFPCSSDWQPDTRQAFDVPVEREGSGGWYALRKNHELRLLCEHDWDQDHWDVRWALSKVDSGSPSVEPSGRRGERPGQFLELPEPGGRAP